MHTLHTRNRRLRSPCQQDKSRELLPSAIFRGLCRELLRRSIGFDGAASRRPAVPIWICSRQVLFPAAKHHTCKASQSVQPCRVVTTQFRRAYEKTKYSLCP